MAKTYWMRFGSGNPQSYGSLSPTFLAFFDLNGATISPPGITEAVAGQGLYSFDYGATVAMGFIVDGATTGLQTAERYISGNLDPNDGNDEKIGVTSSSFGSTSADPSTVYGYLKRIQEHTEGDQIYVKSSGALQLYNRGQSTLLRQKTISDGTSTISKT